MSGDSRRIIGAANPRALAELRAGRQIDWAAEEDGGAKLIAQLLDMPLTQDRRPETRLAHLRGRAVALRRRRKREPVDPSVDLRRVFETTPRATELLHDDLLSDATLKGDGTSIHQLSAQTADTIGTALRKVSAAGVQVADAMHTQRAAELATATRLSELASATFVEAGKPIWADSIATTSSCRRRGCRTCCLTSTSACAASSSSTGRRRQSPVQGGARRLLADRRDGCRSHGPIRSSSPSAPAGRTSRRRRRRKR